MITAKLSVRLWNVFHELIKLINSLPVTINKVSITEHKVFSDLNTHKGRQLQHSLRPVILLADEMPGRKMTVAIINTTLNTCAYNGMAHSKFNGHKFLKGV